MFKHEGQALEKLRSLEQVEDRKIFERRVMVVKILENLDILEDK